MLASSSWVSLITSLINLDAFIAKLNSSLNLSSDDSIDGNTPLIDLGLDSLVAVDIRTWFLQELKIDLPVLKILGGASAVELVTLAAEKLPQEILPKFGEGAKHDPAPEEIPQPADIPRPPPPKPSSGDKLLNNVNSAPAAPKHRTSSTTSTPSYKSSPPPSLTSLADDDPQTPPSEPENVVSDTKTLGSQVRTR